MSETASAFTSEQYENPYPQGIERHYWHRARNRILVRKLRPILVPGARALDIGCGPGIVVDYLRGVGIDCRGVDPGTPIPATSAVASYLTLGVTAADLPDAERASYSVLLLMDVLEHLPEPEQFLQDCLRQFPRATHVFITLPARMEIWSSYDEYYGHYRRYSLASAGELVSRVGLRVASQGYFFHALYAAARVALLRSNKRSHRIAAPRPRALHDLLARILDAEEVIAPAALPGSSLYALCERSLA
jgi:SAM-dependent methyltransferase